MARWQSKHFLTTILTVYAPTEKSKDEGKDGRYQQCQNVLNEVPRGDIVIHVGDVNTHISNDRWGLEQIIWQHGSAQKTSEWGASY